MKIRILVFKLLALCVLSTGVFFVSLNQKVEAADTWFCHTNAGIRESNCQNALAYAKSQCHTNYDGYPGILAICLFNASSQKNICLNNSIRAESSCYFGAWNEANNAWWEALMNGGSHFLMEGPHPVCETLSSSLDQCSEITDLGAQEACVLIARNNASGYNCPGAQ